MKLLRSFAAGVLLLPLTLATFYNLPSAFLSLQSEMESLSLLFSGAILYSLIEGLFNRPMRTYVFGHELTHALASMAFGGRVKDFKVSARGGSVQLTKTNFFVALAPYCIPLYALFVVLAYALGRKFYPGRVLEIVFPIVLGVSLAFHVSLTLYALRQRQPDIHKTGTFFSLVFILLANAWVLIALSKLVFWRSFAVRGLVWGVINTQASLWRWIGGKGLDLIKLADSR